MGKGRRVLGVAALGLGGLVGVLWWMAREGEASSSRDAGADGGIATPLPAAVRQDVLPPALPEVVAADLSAALAPETSTVAVPLDEGDVRAPFDGRVVDPAGEPIPGAAVHHYPSRWMRRKLHLLTDHAATLDPASLAHTTTDAAGRFRLDVFDHPPEPGTVVAPAGEMGWASLHENTPSLLVTHPHYESRVVGCLGWKGGPWSAGDIELNPGASVHGRAVDEHGLPLAGVSVRPPRIGGPYAGQDEGSWWSLKPTLFAMTDSAGRFALGGLDTGPLSLDLRLAGRRTTRLDVPLRRGTSFDAGDVVLQAGAVIEGRVVDDQGRPVPGAHLLARVAKQLETATVFAEMDVRGQSGLRMDLRDAEGDVDLDADDVGYFRFGSLDAKVAPFVLYTDAPGFEVTRSEPITPGGEPIVVVLQRAGSILLAVVDPETGEPIEGATVTGLREASGLGAKPFPLDVTSDPQALQAAGVPPPHAGLHLLSPAGPLGNTAVVTAPGRATRGYLLPSVVAPERATFRATLPREARASGLVVDRHEQPIPGATVKAVPPADLRVDLSPVLQETDDSGRFALGQLAGGEWQLTASARGFVTSEAQTVSVRKGQATEGVRVVLQVAGAIAGVVEQAGQPLPGARVRAMSVARAEAVEASRMIATPGPGGSISYSMNPNPAPGEYQAVADTGGRFRFDDLAPEDFELSGPPGVSLVVGVTAGETTEVVLQARARPLIRGHVRDASGPVEQALVDADTWFEPRNSWLNGDVPARTDAQGGFTLELEAPGRFRVGGRDGAARTNMIELELDWNQTERVELVFPGGAVRGRVVEPDGHPVANARVQLADVARIDGPLRKAGNGRSVRTDAAGRFEFTRVAARPFAVFAAEDGHVEPPAQRVDVPEGDAPGELLFTLQPGGRIGGHVSALGGAALPSNLRVRPVGLDGQPDVGSAKVQQDGAFQCTQLPPGRWRCELCVAEDAPPLQIRDVQVVAGEVAVADFEVTF